MARQLGFATAVLFALASPFPEATPAIAAPKPLIQLDTPGGVLGVQLGRPYLPNKTTAFFQGEKPFFAAFADGSETYSWFPDGQKRNASHSTRFNDGYGGAYGFNVTTRGGYVESISSCENPVFTPALGSVVPGSFFMDFADQEIACSVPFINSHSSLSYSATSSRAIEACGQPPEGQAIYRGTTVSLLMALRSKPATVATVAAQRFLAARPSFLNPFTENESFMQLKRFSEGSHILFEVKVKDVQPDKDAPEDIANVDAVTPNAIRILDKEGALQEREASIDLVSDSIARDLRIGQTALAWGTLKAKGSSDEGLFILDNVELLLVSKRPEAAQLPRFKFEGP